MEKKIIILTKSKKHSGYCVAGIDYETGEWIRLVSSDSETGGLFRVRIYNIRMEKLWKYMT